MYHFLELTNELVINQVLRKENSALYTEIADKIFGTLKDSIATLFSL